MRRICVFTGSSPGAHPAYAEADRRRWAARSPAQGLGLVYGGASVGLMGTVADAALAAGGEVVGVIPQALVDREIAHTGLTELRVVGSMHERKALMAELSDGFVALPGGIGTLEELFEVYTWTQLGLHEQAARPARRARLLRRSSSRSSTTRSPSASSRTSTAAMLVVEQRAGGAARGVQALAGAGALEVDRSLADVSIASIAAAAGEGCCGSATRHACARARGSSRRSRTRSPAAAAASAGTSATPTPGDHQPPDGAVVVGGERDPRRRSRPRPAP